MPQRPGNSNVVVQFSGSLIPSGNYWKKFLSPVPPLKSMVDVAQWFCLAICRFRKTALQSLVFRKLLLHNSKGKQFFWLKFKFEF